MMRKSFTGLILCLVAILALGAQQPGEQSYSDESVMPPGRTGERIRSLIDAINSHDPARIERFMLEDCTERFRKFAPMERHVRTFQSVFSRWGGVDFHGIRTYVPAREDETVVILKDRHFGSWRAFVIRFDEADDFRIAGLQFSVARAPTNVVEPTLGEKELIEEVAAIMNRLAEKDVFSGTLLIARDKDVIFTFAAGEASKRFHAPIDMETRFNLGSMNKMFTSLAVMRLVEQGALSLDDTLDEFLDETWLPKDITSKIKLRHLLSHTSGLGSYFNREYDRSSRQLFRKLDDYKPLIRNEKPAFEPGARFRYSNTGMFLLGVVIESATGEDYFEHIREHIYRPAGMTRSDCYEMDLPVENLAIGYSPAPDSPWKWENNLYKHTIKGGPAGGGFSTVGDLHRFALALLEEKFVPRASLDQMWTDQAEGGYGFGFTIQDGPNGKVVGHGGGFPGINSDLSIYLDTGHIVAVMSNYDQGASGVARRVGELLARLK